MTQRWEYCNCPAHKAERARHLAEDAAQDAADLAKFPPLSDVDDGYDMDETVHPCAVCGALTGNQWELCSRCTSGVDDYSDPFAWGEPKAWMS